MPDKQPGELKKALDNIEAGQPKKKLGGCLRAFVIFLIVLVIIAGILYLLFFSPWTIPGTGLKGESSGQINILVLGRGGEGHSGADLTDTIMLLMIRKKEKRVGMLSIPRDLWIETKGYKAGKINAVYSQGKNSGLTDTEAIGLVKDHVKDITGVTPHYYALIDFEGLSEIVDTLDGVDINVNKAFTDTLHKIDYPQGKNHFNGEQAVMYTRARYATGGEGSDFQRADRQQDLLIAIKNKAMTSDTLFSPSKLSNLSKQYKKHIITDINIKNLSRMRVLAGDLSDENTVKAVYSTGNVLYSTTSSGGAYILLPNSGDWSETREFAKDMFNEKPVVHILNGTREIGREHKTTSELLAAGYKTLKPEHTKNKTHIETKIYNNSDKDFSEEIKNLAKKYDAKLSSEKFADSQADIVIVLGHQPKRENFMSNLSFLFDTSVIYEDYPRKMGAK
jgi:LCP family protein required for cell wall assembly